MKRRFFARAMTVFLASLPLVALAQDKSPVAVKPTNASPAPAASSSGPPATAPTPVEYGEDNLRPPGAPELQPGWFGVGVGAGILLYRFDETPP